MEFGFTNDSREYQRVIAWRDAAIADGWEHGPQSSEAEERWSRLTRDGFVCQILTRSRGNWVPDPNWPNHPNPHGKWAYEAQVSMWGPDGVSVNPGLVYDWGKIEAVLTGHIPYDSWNGTIGLILAAIFATLDHYIPDKKEVPNGGD